MRGARRVELVRARQRQGLTMQALAEALGVEPSTVWRWEHGRSTPYLSLRPRLATMLDVTAEDLQDLLDHVEPDVPAPVRRWGLARAWTRADAGELADTIGAADAEPVTAETAARLTHEWLVVEPPQRVELRAGRRIGQDLVEETARRVAQLRRLDDYVTGSDLMAAVGREVTATATLVRDGAYRDAVGRGLLVALGDLCHLAGRTAADAGQQRAATHYLATGAAAAHAGGRRDLAGECISTLGYQLASATAGSRDAVLLAESAAAGAPTAPATCRAVFYDRLAWAHARTGERSETERALARAEGCFAVRDPEGDPAWVYWFDAGELQIMAGRCFTELHLPHRARPCLEAALAGYEDRPREAALYLSWLAEADLQAGDVDAAAARAGRVLELAGHTASARVLERVRHLRGLLRPYAGRADVDAVEDRYRDLGPA